MPKKIDVVLVALSSPVIVGIYEDLQLVQTIKSDEKSSEVLPNIYKDIFINYDVQNFFYANGPGSFMAIKVAYIFLKSLSILKKIPLFATDAFYFNNNQPIKAIGKLYFVSISQEIKTQKLETAPVAEFILPDVLYYNDFSTTTTPLYGIGAVG